MNKKTRYKKLLRKVRSAKRLGWSCSDMLDEMDILEKWLVANEPGWHAGQHNKYRKSRDELLKK